jgi:hypothetical protein
MSYLLQDLPLSFFCPTSCSNQESEGFFYRQATYKGKYGKAKEAVESTKVGLSPQKRGTWESQKKKKTKEGWSIATRRGREKEKKKTKDGWSIATRRGQEKEKKRKRPRKARRWLQQRQGSVCPKPRIPFFLFTSIWGLEAARLGWSIGSYKTWSTRKPCAKEVPEMDYFMQQKQYLKKDYFTHVEDPTAKHCSKEGLHYCPGAKREESCHETCNKCHMAWVHCKSRCEVFIARKGRTIALERSMRKKAVIWQATINLYSRVGYPLVIPCLGCTA